MVKIWIWFVQVEQFHLTCLTWVNWEMRWRTNNSRRKLHIASWVRTLLLWIWTTWSLSANLLQWHLHQVRTAEGSSTSHLPHIPSGLLPNDFSRSNSIFLSCPFQQAFSFAYTKPFHWIWLWNSSIHLQSCRFFIFLMKNFLHQISAWISCFFSHWIYVKQC